MQLYADNSKNMTNSTSKVSYSDKKSDDSKKDDNQKQKYEDKKVEKQQKKIAKQKETETFTSKKTYNDNKNYSKEDKPSYSKDKQNNTTQKTNYIHQNNTTVQQHGNNNTNTAVEHHGNNNTNTSVEQHGNNNTNTHVEQNHGQGVIINQSGNHVEQHGGGTMHPDVTTQPNGGNHAPEHPDWNQPHPNNNHAHIGHGGYYHDDYQHYFHERRHHWYSRYPFFTFRLRFDTESGFPYNDLYYYPTDYVMVESRLSVLVLPFRYKNDPYKVNSDITDQMMADLDDLHRFNVIDRYTVEKAMNRNDITNSDLVESYPAKKLGRLVGADLVIMGTIEKGSDHYTLSVKCIDPDTGEIVITETATSEYLDTKNINRLVNYLAVLIYNDVPLSEGRITDANIDQVEVNIGSEDGVMEGMRCVVYREGAEVRHPYTGEYLGQRVRKVAEIYLTDVRDNTSTAHILFKNSNIKIGDKIIVK